MSNNENANPGVKRTFCEEFDDRIKNIVNRAEMCGVSVAELCRRAGISRSTPDRWLLRIPKSIVCVDLFLEELEKEEALRHERIKMLGAMSDEDRARFLKQERESKK
ncbi:hypothetical protein RY654_003253 [Escherichia coli]|nr:hypothetical protein [Escherichia coli]